MGVPEGEEGEAAAKKLGEEIMVQNFPGDEDMNIKSKKLNELQVG